MIEDGDVRRLQMPTDLIWASGETGLMGLAIDPDFADNGRFYTCTGGNPQGNPDVRIMVWKMNAAATRATYKRVLISGFPATSGRHGGCRLLILDNGALLVGTGDAATGTNPQDKTSLGGKTLMLDRVTGAPWPTNPFIDAANKRQRYVHTYGHRNVQGLAQRGGRHPVVRRARPRPRRRGQPAQERRQLRLEPRSRLQRVGPDDRPVAARQADRGEVELGRADRSPRRGRRSSPARTWGWYDGTLAVAALKASRVVFMKFDAKGKLRRLRARRPPSRPTAGSAP